MTVGGSGDRDDSGGAGGGEEDEKKVNDNEIVVDEVVRIRDILLNKEDEVVISLFELTIRVCFWRNDSDICCVEFLQSNSVLFHSLRKLESMSLSVDLLKVCFWC